MRWVWLLIAAAALYQGGKAVLPRGIRNNNPGNLKELPGDKTFWVGERATDDDPIFEEFNTASDGIRALARVLTTYHRTYQLNTVAGIITRFAPGSENDTAAYIASVAARLGLEPTQPFNVEMRMTELIAAIIYHENGVQPYTMAAIEEGVQRAWA